MKRLGLIIFFLAVATVAIWYYTRSGRPSLSIDDAQAVEATVLLQKFQEDEAKANQSFLNQVVLVSGKVASISPGEKGHVITLETNDVMSGVRCTVEGEIQVKEGDTVSILGICNGYLADVIVNQASLVKNP